MSFCYTTGVTYTLKIVINFRKNFELSCSPGLKRAATERSLSLNAKCTGGGSCQVKRPVITSCEPDHINAN